MKNILQNSLLLLLGLFSFQILWSQNQWDGDNPNGNLSYSNNWYGDTTPSTWNSSTDLLFNSKNNPSQSSLYQDIGWKPVRSIIYASTFPFGVPLNGDGSGFDVYYKIENNSNHPQVINIPISAKGSYMELNPVNESLTFNGTMYNDNNIEIRIWGSKTITFNTVLGSSGSFAIKSNASVYFNHANTYTGNTYLEAGSLTFGINNCISSSSNIQFKNTIVNTSGYSATVGSLTLQSGNTNSTINLGSGVHSLTFADSQSASWNGTLTINGWGNGSNGKIYVSNSGLTASQLSSITFDGYAAGAAFLADGELIPANPTCIWESSESWTNTVGPSSKIEGTINHTYATSVNGVFTAKKLSVNAGKNFTVDTGTITIVENLVNNGDGSNVVFESGSSLLQTNTTANVGSVTYKRTSNSMNASDFTYWGSAVSNANLSVITPANKWYKYTPVTGWVLITDASSETMEPGTGYIARIPSNGTQTATFVGTPVNGNVPVVLSASSDYYLFGNPYPSAIDLELFGEENQTVLKPTYYFWTHTTPLTNGQYASGDYATYSVDLDAGTVGTAGSPAGSRYVASGQGFFAEIQAAGTVTFKNTHRVAANNSTFFRTSNTATTQKVWFNLTNAQGVFKQILLAYTPNASNGFDSTDATSFDAHPYVDFYTLADNQKLTIQAREPFTSTDAVALGYKSNLTGEFSIAIDHLDNSWNNQNIYLKDNDLQVTHNLSQSPYTFATQIGTFNNRFEIVYQPSVLQNTEFTGSVVELLTQKQLVINASTPIETVTVYNTLGSVIYRQAVQGNNSVTLDNLSKQNQPLLVHVTLSNGITETKKTIY